jgi:hypothetical protein
MAEPSSLGRFLPFSNCSPIDSRYPLLYQPFSVPPSLLSSEPVFPSSVAESALSDKEDFALGRDATRRSPPGR